ncbi:MAG: alginate lyase family protein, partial [Planctomycetota bacterium]
GQRNPEGTAYDNHALQDTWGRVWRLALAAWLLDERRFAEHALLIIRRWFVDADTRMNPHLEYAQHIPGHCDGRGIGIIDTALIPEVLDTTALLADLKAWPDSVAQVFDQWCRDYLNWLLTSTHGRDERRWHNNHANYYDLQVAALARATGQDGIAVLTLENVAHRRIATQIEPDGRLPDELVRTLSQHYVLYNLAAFVTLAELGRPIDVDPWNFETHDGRSMEKAIRWFVDHGGLTPEWAGQQIDPFDYSGCVWLLRQAGTRLDPAFHAMTADLPGIDPTVHLANLLYPAPQPQRQSLG